MATVFTLGFLEDTTFRISLKPFMPHGGEVRRFVEVSKIAPMPCVQHVYPSDSSTQVVGSITQSSLCLLDGIDAHSYDLVLAEQFSSSFEFCGISQ